MKEVNAYIQPLALGSLLQNRDDIPDFPVAVSEYDGLGRKASGQVEGKVYAIDGFKDGNIWRDEYAG